MLCCVQGELEKISGVLSAEYECRRRMLIKRLDVTVQSFSWSDRAKARQTLSVLFCSFWSRFKFAPIMPFLRLLILFFECPRTGLHALNTSFLKKLLSFYLISK